ncbi:MAG: glycyl-radical enzyme activating protein [Opitutaceae bacterium]|jgi:pyruvate formate lyase activating enzyme|nr:glycyl-radical enzyme activating protein [Opitutaceae bacterium]
MTPDSEYKKTASGRILDIKRFSLHDGPGIRTTVFLKGCRLRCRWCHNPEGIFPKAEIGFLKRRCIACEKCAEVCPVGAHVFNKNGHVFDHTVCAACGKCVDACLSDALEFHGRDMSAEKAARTVLEDRVFYQKSGGGCTVSGGEPLLQAEFCAELFRILKRNGIHCAVDTCGAMEWEKIEMILPHADLFLYDLKHTDSAVHLEQTGRGNGLILENLQKLSQCGVPVEIRIPVIPGFNADGNFMREAGSLLASLRNITTVRLLPFHSAHSKCEAIGRHDDMTGVAPPSGTQIEIFANILRKFHLNIQGIPEIVPEGNRGTQSKGFLQ